MESEVRVIETPRFDTDYWLCRCEGFEVDTPEGRLGIVEWLVSAPDTTVRTRSRSTPAASFTAQSLSP
jgi:hypothetical protein